MQFDPRIQNGLPPTRMGVRSADATTGRPNNNNSNNNSNNLNNNNCNNNNQQQQNLGYQISSSNQNSNKHSFQTTNMPSPYYASPARVASADAKHMTTIGRSVVLANQGTNNDELINAQNLGQQHQGLPTTPPSKDKMDNIKAIQMIYQQTALKQGDRNRNQNSSQRNQQQQNQVKQEMIIEGNNQGSPRQSLTSPRASSPYNKASKKNEANDYKSNNKHYKQVTSSPYYSKPASSKRQSSKQNYIGSYKFQKSFQKQQRSYGTSSDESFSSRQSNSSRQSYSKPWTANSSLNRQQSNKNNNNNNNNSQLRHGISRGSMQASGQKAGHSSDKEFGSDKMESSEDIMTDSKQLPSKQQGVDNNSNNSVEGQQIKTMQAYPNGRLNTKRQTQKNKNQGQNVRSSSPTNSNSANNNLSQQKNQQLNRQYYQLDQDMQDSTQCNSTTIVNGWMGTVSREQSDNQIKQEPKKQRKQKTPKNNNNIYNSSNNDNNSNGYDDGSDTSQMVNGHLVTNSLLFRQRPESQTSKSRPQTSTYQSSNKKEQAQNFTQDMFVQDGEQSSTWTSFPINTESLQDEHQNQEQQNEQQPIRHDYGMTLEQYIQSMCTTPANDNSTTGLGIDQWNDENKTPYSVSPEPQLSSEDQTLPPSTPGSFPPPSTPGSIGVVHNSSNDMSEMLDLMDTVGPSETLESNIIGKTCKTTQQSNDENEFEYDFLYQRNVSSTGKKQDQGRISSDSQNSMLNMANANDRDLRPATAFDVTFGDQNGEHSSSSTNQEIKEVDLASLSSTIFQPKTAEILQIRNERQKYQTPLSMYQEAWADQKQQKLAKNNKIQNSEYGRQSIKKKNQTSQIGAGQLPTRQIQSARAGHVYDKEVDPTVWQSTSIPRPPSRQKPPPEALHLFSPEHSCGIIKQDQGRPATAIGMMRRQKHNLQIGTGTGFASSYERPPSRQRPPPESLNLGFDSTPNRRESGRRKFSASSTLQSVKETIEV